MHRVSRFRPLRIVVMISLAPLAAAQPASAEWPPFGRAVCTAPDAQTHAAITSDGAGGAIITWQDDREGVSNIFAQHVLASGAVDPAWPGDGRALLTDRAILVGADDGQISPAIVADGAGGAIVSWQDLRGDVDDFDIYAQHILATGEVDPAWPANGTALCLIQGQQSGQVMVPDGAGGAVVAWTDARPGASVSDIFAQHVLASGITDPLWPVNGLAVGAAPGLQEFPTIVEDGAGGAIVAWDDSRSGVTGIDVYAQHVMNSGVVDPAWPANGTSVCTANGDQGRGTIATDGAFGAIVAWTDARNSGTEHIFAQHVLASGLVDPVWPVNGRAISNAAVIESRPLAVADGAGGAVVNWQGFTVQLNMYVQHVTATGVVDPAWPAGGRALSDADRQQSHAAIVPDGSGGAIIAWEDSLDVVAQHVQASGDLDPTYPDAGRAVCNLPSQQGDAHLVATGGGGAIVTWTDTRNGQGADIFAMQVLEAGTVDVRPQNSRGVSFAPPFPNPAKAALALHFTLPRSMPIRLTVYDVNGRSVRELVSGARPAGDQTIAWDLRDGGGQAVDPGLYFARLDTGGRAITVKFVTLR